MIQLLRLSRDEKGASRWLEPVIDRIRSMSDRFDGNADGLIDGIWKQYAEKSPFLGLFVGVDDDEIVGHALAFIQQWDARWVVWITQVEVDHPVERGLVQLVLAKLSEWAHEVNAKYKGQVNVEEMIFVTPRMNDAWARHSGFADYRFMKRRRIMPARGEQG